MNLRVVVGERHDISPYRVTWREVIVKPSLTAALVTVSGPWRWFGFALAITDVLWPLWSVEGRALHDFVAGTRVESLVR